MIPVLGVPTLLGGDNLRRLLASIDHPVEHLVIIDNGRWWPRRRPLDNFATPRSVGHVTVTECAGNLGVAGAWNLVIKSTPFVPWWLLVNDDVWFSPGHLDTIVAEADSDTLLLTGVKPGGWSCFAIGDEVVDKVGLFDERFHPAYFEDDDYARRCAAHEVRVAVCDVEPHHENSSTLQALRRDEMDANHITFDENARLHHRKIAEGDLSDGWTLNRRRKLAWESR